MATKTTIKRVEAMKKIICDTGVVFEKQIKFAPVGANLGMNTSKLYFLINKSNRKHVADLV